MISADNWKELYATQAESEAKRLDAFGRKLGRCIAASKFHDRAANLRTAAEIIRGRAGLEHHLEHAIKIVERGGLAT